MPGTVVLLHGFGNTRRGWDLVARRIDRERYRPLALDLRGHGAATAQRPISFAACVADVAPQAPERFALCGYSLGGRVALHVALAHPERVTRLVLVAATAGIEEPVQRAERRAADEALAAFAERSTIAAFADRWLAQPMFAADPPAAVAFARADLLRNDPAALAAVLRGIGTGAMEPLWDRLGELGMPVTVVAGERDGKFVALGERLGAALPDAELVVVPGAGHGLPREAPQAVAEAIARPRAPASSEPRSGRLRPPAR
jgi:2-succinyl-6-hydroxy-2,4-cyclohexadiene-1-carboxylate synthase